MEICTQDFVIFTIYALCFVLVFLRLNKQKSLIPLLETLSDLRIGPSLSNNIDFEKGVCDSGKYIAELMKEACFQAKPHSYILENINEQILKDEDFRLAKQRFFFVLLIRMVTISTLSIFARVCIHLSFAQNSKMIIDCLCLIFSIAVMFAFFLFMESRYPKSWFLDETFTTEAKEWLQAAFEGELQKTSPVYASWHEICERESYSGISLASTRHLLLSTWRSKKNIELQKRLRVFEDYVPVIEFASLGIGSTMILACPVWLILNSTF